MKKYSLSIFLVALILIITFNLEVSSFSLMKSFNNIKSKTKKVLLFKITEGMKNSNFIQYRKGDGSTSSVNNSNNNTGKLPSFSNKGLKCVQYMMPIDLQPKLCANGDQNCNSKGVMLFGLLTTGEYKAIVTEVNKEYACSFANFEIKNESIIGKTCFTHNLDTKPDEIKSDQEIPEENFSHRVCVKGNKKVGVIVKQGTKSKCDKATFEQDSGDCKCYKTLLPNDTSLKPMYFPLRYSNNAFQCIKNNNICKNLLKESECLKLINTEIAETDLKSIDSNLVSLIKNYYFNRWICPSESGLNFTLKFNTEFGDNYSIQCLGRDGNDCFFDKNAEIACARVNSCPDGMKEFKELECASENFKKVWNNDGFAIHTPTWCKAANAYLKFDQKVNVVSIKDKKIGLVMLADGMTGCIPDPTVKVQKCLEENDQNILDKSIKLYNSDRKNFDNLIECKGKFLLDAKLDSNHWCAKSIELPNSNGKMKITFPK